MVGKTIWNCMNHGARSVSGYTRIVLAWVFLCWPMTVKGAEILVPQDVSQISAAIDLALDGDEIIVSPGDWPEPINFNGKNIIVRSSEGPEVTRLIGNGNGSVVSFISGEISGATLEGFTLQSGGGTLTANGLLGGGILIMNSYPTIRDCIIENNSAASGAGIHIEGPTFGNVTVDSVVIRNNSAADSGGGMCLNNSAEATLLNCHFENNVAEVVAGAVYCEESSIAISDTAVIGNASNLAVGGIWVYFDSEALIENCLFENNSSPISGGAVAVSDQARATIERSIFRDNMGGSSGGAILLDSGSNQETQIIRECVFHNNFAANSGAHLAVSFNPLDLLIEKCTFGLTGTGSAEGVRVNNSRIEAVRIDSTIVMAGDGGSIVAIPGSTSVTYSCVENLSATAVIPTDSIDEDPLFTDAENGVYTLESGSPCLNNGNPLLPLDADGTLTDMGALGVAPLPKSEFRRGDVDGSGSANIGDAIQILAWLFIPGTDAPTCEDSSDANDDGSLNVSDAITLLDALFVSGDPLPAPYGSCGIDPTDDPLTCEADCP